jgi:hypothetical protein
MSVSHSLSVMATPEHWYSIDSGASTTLTTPRGGSKGAVRRPLNSNDKMINAIIDNFFIPGISLCRLCRSKTSNYRNILSQTPK